MNRTDLIREVALAARVNQTVAEMALDAALETITRAAVDGETVRLRGFGVFRMQRTAPRTMRNPRTAERVSVPARMSLRFTPASHLRKIVVD